MQGPNLSSLSTARNRYIFTALALVTLLTIWAISSPSAAVTRAFGTPHRSPLNGIESMVEVTARLTDYFDAYRLDDAQFGQMAKRLQILKDWIQASEGLELAPTQAEALSDNIEKYALSLVPFIRNPLQPNDKSPLQTLRKSFEPGSRGIVIAAGQKDFRYACHLVANLRHTLHSNLPIQIAFAGDDDLPKKYRDYFESMGTDVSTLDVTAAFDQATLRLAGNGWAIKPFALLASGFEQAILLDADAVFLQDPDFIFDNHPGFIETGTLLFHDRLLWQGAFKERHQWWETELAHTKLSDTILKSKVYMEGYAEEGDSGVVVVDKSRLAVLVGLLHICWQSTEVVREKHTYRMGHGEKESWWFGFELVATPYTMEHHYAAIVGRETIGDSKTKVCGFTIAHVNQVDKLLWYNGSLLKNKEVNRTEYDVPSRWMIDGVWEKGATKQDLSCMTDAPIRPIDGHERKVLEASVATAKKVDEDIRDPLHNLIEIT